MKDSENRWWPIGLAGLILFLALTLGITQTQFAEQMVGLLGLIVLGTCLVALLLIIAALWPGFTLRTRANLESSPGKTLMIGLVNYIFLGAITLVSMELGPIAIVGIALSGMLLTGTFLGLPAAGGLVGARLHSLREQETTHWGEIAGGSIALYLAILIPVVGWFILLPALCLWSFGAAALTLASRRKPKPPSTDHVEQ